MATREMTPYDIRQHRHRLGLSQSEYLALTGIRITRLEAGARQPTLANLKTMELVEERHALKERVALLELELALLR